ncbi:MAG: flagellar M-ring protein FliF [Treponema sp.]|jgi:flagellar M-ring protein FliF|nr:flagellar M-ring protein FliF [Treponema sp.]
MNGFIKKMAAQIKTLWGKWSLIQKLILFGIIAAVIIGVIAMVSVSSTPAMAPVIDAPIRDEMDLDRIVTRINAEGIRTSVTPNNIVMVSDEMTARRMRAILIREDLIPANTDPWSIFDRERWTLTDFERNVNLQRANRQMITDHIKSLDDVDNAEVIIVVPPKALFASEQEPVSASVMLVPKPGSDITANRKKIEGIQKLIKFATPGLQDENIVITDQNGLVLNDFAGMAEWDRLKGIEQETKLVRQQEATYRAQVLKLLQSIFSDDRVRDLMIKIDMDMSQRTVEKKEYGPIILKERTPGLSYDDSQMVQTLPRSQSTSTTKWEGSGLIPEGPAGVEGQTPPVMRDADNLYGKVEQQTQTVNNELNEQVIHEVQSASGMKRVTVSVNIDGRWKIKYDEKGEPVQKPGGGIEREYEPLAPEELRSVQALIQGAVGYSAARGDSVTVQNIPFDRTRQFAAEDAVFFREQQFRLIVLLGIGGLAALLAGFVVFRIIRREMERRRRMREEELSRQQQAMRESVLMDAENEGVEVSMSVEERKRMELLDNAVSMAKEHPGDVAQLIRTWLLEE